MKDGSNGKPILAAQLRTSSIASSTNFQLLQSGLSLSRMSVGCRRSCKMDCTMRYELLHFIINYFLKKTHFYFFFKTFLPD